MVTVAFLAQVGAAVAAGVVTDRVSIAANASAASFVALFMRLFPFHGCTMWDSTWCALRNVIACEYGMETFKTQIYNDVSDYSFYRKLKRFFVKSGVLGSKNT
jgi:hypothetical protein